MPHNIIIGGIKWDLTHNSSISEMNMNTQPVAS